MFWGGEMTRPITLNTEKTLPRVRSQSKSTEQEVKKVKSLEKVFDINGPSIELKIAAGAPTRSRYCSFFL